MGDSHRFWNSSIGRKSIVAVTGSALVLFLIAHLAGNLQVFAGPDAINSYGEGLRRLPLLVWTMRIGLLVMAVVHVYFAVWLTRENRAARPVRYKHPGTIQASLPSRTMILTGLLVLAYTIYHLMHFTFGNAHPEYFHVKDDLGRHDIYRMMVASFRNPIITAAYMAAMIVLFFHLRHGVHSMFQTLGLNNPIWDKRLNRMAGIFSFLIFVGYTSMPAAVVAGILKLPGE